MLGKRIVLIVAIVIIIFGTTTFISQQVQLKNLQEERLAKRAEIERLTLIRQTLLEELQNADDLGYIETIAREKFKMVKPDEIIYVINGNNE